jgi:hypothetical protein
MIAPNGLPTPLPDREGYIGGIESISIDDKRWFFGFSYSNDVVLTPLIDDADVMAAFASRYMLQRDGARDAAYWRELVEDATDGSGLTFDAADRVFTTAEFRHIASSVAATVANSGVLPDFSINYHLLYLLSAAVGDEPPSADPTYVSALQKIGIVAQESPALSSACEALEMVTGSRPLPAGATLADAAAALHLCLADFLTRAPGNWCALFQALIQP